MIEVEFAWKFVIAEFLQRLPERLRAICRFGLLANLTVDAAALFGDLGEIAHALAGDQHGCAWFLKRRVDSRRPLFLIEMQLAAHQPAQVREHPGHARIVELAGDRWIDRHFFVGQLERDAVALPLLAHVAQRVFGAALVVLVQHDEFGEVDHVDLLELARRAVVARHDVHWKVDQIDDFRIGLADAGRLDDDEVVALPFEKRDAVLEHDRSRRVLAARRHRAHEHALAAQRSHADAIAEQRAAGSPACRIDRQHRDAHLWKSVQKAQKQLVHDAGLAGATGAGKAEHWGKVACT